MAEEPEEEFVAPVGVEAAMVLAVLPETVVPEVPVEPVGAVPPGPMVLPAPEAFAEATVPGAIEPVPEFAVPPGAAVVPGVVITVTLPEIPELPILPGVVPVPELEMPVVTLVPTESAPTVEEYTLPADPPSIADASFWQTPSLSKV